MGLRVFFPSSSQDEKRTGKRAEYLMLRSLKRVMILGATTSQTGLRGVSKTPWAVLAAIVKKGVRLVIRAIYKLRRVCRDSVPEVEFLELADKVRSDDLIIRLRRVEVGGDQMRHQEDLRLLRFSDKK